MNNAEKFKSVFGIYATELWAMPEKDFLEWINAEMNIKDEIYPKIKADVRLSGNGTLWVKTDKKTLEDAQRVIIEDGKTWCKQFYAEQPQPEIIHCKDCRYYKQVSDDEKIYECAWGFCHLFTNRSCKSINFCSWAEQREETDDEQKEKDS